MATVGQQGSGYSVGVTGLDTCLSILTRAGAQLHDLDESKVRLANSQLRRAAKNLADQFGTHEVAPLVARYGGPQGPKMADTIRPKADRMPIVRIGAVNPRLTGFRARNKRAATSRRNISPSQWKGSLAWGVEKGPKPAGRSPNPYGRARRDGGYILGPRLDELQRILVPYYVPLIAAAMSTAGWPLAESRAA